MSKSMAREKRPQAVDTEDHITERVLEAAAWAERHRRTVIAGGIALMAVVAAAFYYQGYKEKLVQSASVRLQEIQISAQSADIETIRGELRLFVDQYQGTPFEAQARVALADLELRRDSLGAAIRALEPIADMAGGNPLAYTAAGMIAAAFEQAGDSERAMSWYRRIESEALFDYQRRDAMAEQARLHTAAGRYEEAASLYERLASDVGEDPAAQDLYAVRLGEVRALALSGAAPPAGLPAATEEVPAPSMGGEEAVPTEESGADG